MNEIFNLLAKKEQKIIGALCLVLFFALLFLFFVAFGVKRTYFSSIDYLGLRREAMQKMELSKKENETEWRMWRVALDDIRDLKTKYLYQGNEGIAQIMNDLQKIISEARIQVTQKRYDYSDLEEEGYKVVRITFETAGSYWAIKKIVHSVEIFPKLLVVEKIDFLNVDPQFGGFKFRVIMAGYYVP